MLKIEAALDFQKDVCRSTGLGQEWPEWHGCQEFDRTGLGDGLIRTSRQFGRESMFVIFWIKNWPDGCGHRSQLDHNFNKTGATLATPPRDSDDLAPKVSPPLKYTGFRGSTILQQNRHTVASVCIRIFLADWIPYILTWFKYHVFKHTLYYIYIYLII